MTKRYKMYKMTMKLMEFLLHRPSDVACPILCAAPPISPLFFIPIVIVVFVADTALLPFIVVVKIGASVFRTLRKALKK